MAPPKIHRTLDQTAGTNRTALHPGCQACLCTERSGRDAGIQAISLPQSDFTQQAGWVASVGFQPPYAGILDISDTAANLSDPSNLGGGQSFDAGLGEEIGIMLAENAA